MKQIYVRLGFLGDVCQYCDNEVRCNDASISPYWDYGGVIDTPSVLFVRLIDDVEAFYERREESGIDSFPQALQHVLLFSLGFSPRLRWKMAAQSQLDMLAIGAKGRSEADEMSCGESRTGSSRDQIPVAIDVLDDSVLDDR